MSEKFEPVRWGVLGAARIAEGAVLPGMVRSPYCAPRAIAARDAKRASEMAGRLGVPRSYGDYDALLEDPGIEAVYVALPNHLHVEWARRAADAGKHVLVARVSEGPGLAWPQSKTRRVRPCSSNSPIRSSSS